MRSNRKHSTEELVEYIKLYLNDGLSYKVLCNEYGLLLSVSVFNENVLRYLSHGLSGIQSNDRNNHYSKEFKLSVVREYIDGNGTIRGLARKYNIPGKSTVRNWIIKYTEGKYLRASAPKPEVYTMKGKKTTQEEKIKIVKDYLSEGLSYVEAAEKHQVSYNNIYAWVQKYKKHGPDGLIDGRGRGKPDEIQTDEEKLKTEIAALKARNEYLRTENAALKKLKEVERELMLRKRGMKPSTKRSRGSKRKDSK